MATKKIRKDGVIQSESEEEKTKRLPSKKGVKQTDEQKAKIAASETMTKKLRRVQPEIDQAIQDKLFSRDTSGKTFITSFISKCIDEAKKDPNSRMGIYMADKIFGSGDLITRLDAEVNKAMARDTAFQQYQIRNTLYDKQQEVYDNSTDKFMIVINSRRSGKTELMGRLLAKRVCRPDQHCVYINRSFDAAVRQIQKPLETALEAAGLHYRGTINGGKIEFDNGSWILIVGNNNASDVNKLRGEKLALVLCDECGHMRHLRELINEIIAPATMDYADSQIVMVGTPPRTRNGFVQELWEKGNIRKYHWTFKDNPFIPNKDNVIQEACEMFGISPDSNFIKREYLGDMYAYDTEAIYIKHYDKAEPGKDKLYSHAYVAVDWGYEDKAAVVGMLADKNAKKLYIVKDWSEAKKGIVEISQRVQEMVEYLKNNYRLDREPQVICDTNEKSAAQDLYTTYHISNVMLAYKYDLNYALDQLSDWFTASTVVVSPNAKATIEDADNMIWKRNEDTDQIIHELDDDSYHGNAMFAVLYASRQFAYDVMGLIAENKPAKEITNAKEFVQQYETFEDNRTPTGIMELGDAEVARHFVR